MADRDYVICTLSFICSLCAGSEFRPTFCATTGDITKVKALLAKGADVNAKTNDGKTALMYAADKGYTEIVRLLKQAGAKE